MKKRKWILPVSIIGGVIALCLVAVVAFGAILSAKGFGISTGLLYFAENGTYLIDSDDMAMRVSDRSDDEDLFEGYQNGDKVILFHDGVNETYPAQTGGYRVIRLSKGDGTYKPADEVLGIVQTLGNDGKLRLDKATIEISEMFSSFDGVEIQIVNAVWNDEETKFDIMWNNETTYDVVYGEYYKIEKETNGEWKSCATPDMLSFTDIGYELSSKSSQRQTYNLTDMFDISENSKYRFSADCLVYENGRGAGSTECEMWVEFIVTRVDDNGTFLEKSRVDFEAQYIRTGAQNYAGPYPSVAVICSVDELTAYYETNKDQFYLERREDPASDSTIGFLDACDKYDAAFFEEHALVFVILEEGSGSTRHNIEFVKVDQNGVMYISVLSIDPEVGTCDMAYWHIMTEIPKDNVPASEEDVVVYYNGVNQKTKSTTVRETGSYSNITLTIPHDWEYEVEREDSGSEYCIAFWPEGQSEGKIKMWYYTAFGVCGTGLEEEEISVGEYEAWQGTYDNKLVWDFISFRGMAGSYVAMNEGAEKWWSEYGDEAMQILSTVKLSEDILTEEQVIELVKKDVTVEYNQTDARFDTEKGYWTIVFSKKNTAGGDQVFTVTHEGKILDVEYGE